MENLSSVHIRRAEERDIGDLVALVGDDPRHLPWRSLHASKGSSQVFCYLAEDEAPFGFVIAGDDPLALGENHGQILAIYMRPSHRGFGMGKKLLVRGLSVLKRRGYESALVWVPAGAEAPRALIVSLGFEADDSERLVNVDGGGSLVEKGYRLSLKDYF